MTLHRGTPEKYQKQVVAVVGLFLLLIFLVLLIRFHGSTAKEVAAASRQQAKQLLHNESACQTPSSQARDTGTKQVFVDASASMAGYVRGRGAKDEFEKLLKDIAYIMPNAAVYRYGQSGRTPPKKVSQLFSRVQFGRSLDDPSFYTLNFNPDNRLVDMLDNENNPGVSVLVTDGVYSATSANASSVVVDAIAGWLKKGRYLGILIFRSPYSGDFYSEQNRGWLHKPVHVPNRPFYAFVFSETQQGFVDVQTLLARDFPDMETLFFSPTAVRCSVDTRMPMSEKSLSDFSTPPQEPFYWEMFDSGLFRTVGDAVLDYTVTYDIQGEYPASQISLTVTPTYYYAWSRKGFQKTTVNASVVATDSLSQVCSPTKAPLSAPVESSCRQVPIKLFREPKAQYGLYGFLLKASVLSLRREIRVLSTEDDSITRNADRTYRFYDFVSALTAADMKIDLCQA